MNKWNPRYIAFARSQGRTPEEQLEHDERRMHSFILWITQKWIEYKKQAKPGEQLSHRAFDAWLGVPWEVTLQEGAWFWHLYYNPLLVDKIEGDTLHVRTWTGTRKKISRKEADENISRQLDFEDRKRFQKEYIRALGQIKLIPEYYMETR